MKSSRATQAGHQGARAPLCRDCAHMVRPLAGFGLTYAKCGHPLNASPVDGAPLRYCETMRNGMNECGPAARLFSRR